MIPNGKQMDWNGHNLTFESEHDQCTGCFFANKNECPDCDEGIWVEENPSPWHTGTPTENGTYVCRMKDDFAKWLVLNFKNGIWNVDGTSQSFADVGYNDCIEKWMKIAEEEET